MPLFGSRARANQPDRDPARARHAAEAEASGLQCLKAGNLESAEVELRRCVDLLPQYALGHGYLGLALYRLGRLDEAESELSVALRLTPEDEVLCRTHGMILEAMGRSGEAEDAYLAAIASNPQSARAHAALGSLALKRGDLAKAEEAVVKALSIDPRDAQALGELTDIRHRLGNQKGAISTVRQGLVAHPNNVAFHFKLGLLLEEARDFRGAIAELRSAYERKPQDPDILFALSRSLLGADEEGTVQALYERAMRALPQYSDRYEADLYRLLVEYASSGGDPEQREIVPQTPRVIPMSGNRHIQTPNTAPSSSASTSADKSDSSRPPETVNVAIKSLEAAVRSEPRNTKLLRDLSILYMRAGRLVEAKDIARRAEAMRSNPSAP